MIRSMRQRGSLARTLADDRRGATIVEFAIIAPVLCMVLLASFDIAHTLYMRGVVQGIVQKAARDATLESGTDVTIQNTLDSEVRRQVKALTQTADVAFKRRFYRSFSEAAAARAERYTESNGNMVCDNGEPYDDENGNGVWDPDGGNQGQGGAKDATLYTVTVTYPRMFPVYGFLGFPNTVKITSSTVLRNQPYSDQGTYAPVQVRNCP